MLFRRRIITPGPTEREVVVVKPRRPGTLYAALGLATVCMVGLIGYFSYAVYDQGQRESQSMVATEPVRTDRRAQRMANPAPQRVNRPPTTIIVNPPPVIQVTPPAPNPPVAKQPEKTIIVNGAPEEEKPVDPRLDKPQGQDDGNASDSSSSQDE